MSSFIPLSESVIGKQFCQWCDDWRTMLAITYCDGETLYRCTLCQAFCDEPDWENEYDEENEEPTGAGPCAWGWKSWATGMARTTCRPVPGPMTRTNGYEQARTTPRAGAGPSRPGGQ